MAAFASYKHTQQGRLLNFSLIALSVLFCLLALEIVATMTPRSNGAAISLAGSLWRKKHWTVNREDFRDINHSTDSANKKTKVAVIGDSFVAGAGLEKVEQRFSNKLAAMLGDPFEVYNFGASDSATSGQFKILHELNFSPGIVIYSYYGNDIEEVAIGAGDRFSGFKPYADLGELTQYVVTRSYLFNYIYWSFPKPYADKYIAYLKSAFENQNFLNEHLKGIQRIIDHCKSKNIKLFTVIFPFIQDPENSGFYVTPIRKHLENHQIPVVDVRELVKGKLPKELVVNSNDAHANEFVNELVAKALYEVISREWPRSESRQ